MTPTHNSIRITKPLVSSRSDLPSVFMDWNQAVTDLHQLYQVLMETIAKRKQQTYNLTHQVARPVNHNRLSDLDKVLVETVQELNRLVNDMNELSDFTHESPQMAIKHLHSHKVRLQKQAKRIQQVLGLSKSHKSIGLGRDAVHTQDS